MEVVNTVHHYALSGVYNSTYEMRFDGGPKCAAESSFQFKFIINMILVSDIKMNVAIV